MPVTDKTLQLMRRLRIDLEAVTEGHVKELTGAYADAWDAVVDELREALLDLAERDDLNQTALLRSSRVASALQAIADQLDRLAASTAVVITDGAGQVTSIAVTTQAAIAASQLPAKAVGIQLATVNPDIIGSIVARTAAQITARTRPLPAAALRAVNEALVRGAAASDNPLKVARRMVSLARAGGVDLPLRRAEAISRTELLDAARQAQQAWDEANSSTLTGWEWLSARDLRTCPVCWSLDGSVHELTEPGPWGHVSCRCSRMTRTKTWRELGIDLPEPDDARLSAEDHFRSLSRDEQLQIMGPGRLKALDDGRVSWDQLGVLKPNADWRPSWQVRPLRDLPPAGRP